jgi:hypothetical protein
MARTVTALYDTKAEAEAARKRLSSEVQLKDGPRLVEPSSAEGSGTQGKGPDFSGIHLSDEEKHLHTEALRRGGFMLYAQVKDEEEAGKIIRILSQTPKVDIDRRQDVWRQEGWQPHRGAAGGSSAQSAPPRSASPPPPPPPTATAAPSAPSASQAAGDEDQGTLELEQDRPGRRHPGRRGRCRSPQGQGAGEGRGRSR